MRDISIVGWGGKPSCKCKAPLCSETSLVLSTYLLFSPNFWDDSPTWEVFKIPCWCIWHMAYGISEFSASIMEPLFSPSSKKGSLGWFKGQSTGKSTGSSCHIIGGFSFRFSHHFTVATDGCEKSLLTTCHRWAIWQVSMEMSENPGEVDTEAGKLGIKAAMMVISSTWHNLGKFDHDLTSRRHWNHG